MNIKPRKGLFLKLNGITICAVYVLILVGGIVRSTGAGMGCPDWPKCFGRVIPPTHEDELPENYQELFLQKRIKKNERLASTLNFFGFTQMASKIVEGELVLQEQPFNATKTWIEYINRLVGVVIGLLIVSCAVVGFSYVVEQTIIFVLSIIAVIVVSFQGWVGSLVVNTNLLPGMISFHMILAIGLIGLLIYIRHRVLSKTDELVEIPRARKMKRVMLLCMSLFFAQVLLGVQVREAIDTIAHRLGETQRWNWINELGLVFYIHRSYSLVLLAIHGYLAYKLLKGVQTKGFVQQLVNVLVGCIVLEIISGAVLSYFALPFFVQPIHLLLALLIFGIQYYLYLQISDVSRSKKSLVYA